MSFRSPPVRGPLTGLVALVLSAIVAFAALHFGTGGAWASTNQYGCTFSVPTPSITGGKSSFKVSATCASSKDKRNLDVELVADDPSYDDTLRTASTSIPAGKGNHSVTGEGWSCHEDATGKDEVYLRVRIEDYQSKSWHKAKWVNGSAANGDCH